MKKRTTLLITITLAFIVIGSCLSCISPQSDSNATATNTVDTTNEVGNDFSGELNVSGVQIKQEAPVTIWEFLDNVLSSWFWRSILIVLLIGLFTGNLHPCKNLSFIDKKE